MLQQVPKIDQITIKISYVSVELSASCEGLFQKFFKIHGPSGPLYSKIVSGTSWRLLNFKNNLDLCLLCYSPASQFQKLLDIVEKLLSSRNYLI